MTSAPFPSQSRNGEDVVLWRALRQVAPGRAVEVGADDAAEFSPLRALREQGWTVLAPANAGDAGDAVRAAGWVEHDVHVLAGRDEAETSAAVAALAAIGVRPWVVVSASASRAGEAAAGPDAAILSQGYAHCLYDGLNNVYVLEGRAELSVLLSYSACARDEFTTPELRRLQASRDELGAQLAQAAQSVMRWRAAALHRWGDAAGGGVQPALARELEAMRNTISWRVTRPLRAVRRRMPGTLG